MEEARTYKDYFEVVKMGDTAQIYLYGTIGTHDWWDGEYDYRAETLVKEINKLCETHDEVHIHINSDGGSTKHGAAIINAIKANLDKVHTFNDGVAYSMASEILLAAKKSNIHIAENAMTMIHSASGYVYGNAKQLREYAEYLDKLTNTNAKMLAAKFDTTEQDFITKYYDGNDHFLDADDFKAMGFEIEGATEALPNVDKKDFKAVRAYFEQQRREQPKAPQKSKGIFNFFTKKSGEQANDTTASDKDELDMSKIKDIDIALKNGDITEEELKALLDNHEANKPLTRSEFKTLLKTTLAEINKGNEQQEAAAVSPQLEEINKLQEEIEALKKSDGGTITPPGGKKDSDEEHKVSKFHSADNSLNQQAMKDLGL